MTLQEVFETMLHGELSMLSIAENGVDKLSERDQSKLVSHINMGLTALHTRFPIKEGRIMVGLSADRREYPLEVRFALSEVDSPIPVDERFIIDDEENPFTEDILKITSVLTDMGTELTLNNKADPYTIRTPTTTRLVVPEAIVKHSQHLPDDLLTNSLDVVYRANHPKIDVQAGDYDAYTVQVDLPEVFLHPLALFVGMRMHTPHGVGQVEGMASQAYAARYEQACRSITDYGAVVDLISDNDRLRAKGFV